MLVMTMSKFVICILRSLRSLSFRSPSVANGVVIVAVAFIVYQLLRASPTETQLTVMVTLLSGAIFRMASDPTVRGPR